MSGSCFDLYIQQGSTFNLGVTVKDCYGNPMNLSGYSGYLLIQEKFGESGILGNINVTITNYLSGQIQLSLPYTGTAALSCTQARYALKLIDSGQNAMNYLKGYAYIGAEVGNLYYSNINILPVSGNFIVSQ